VPFGIGATEIIILLLVALLVFGPKRLPEMGRSLGKGMREFKDSISGKDPDEEEQRQRELAASTTGENEPVVTARERDSA
jgi:sec-independent protein translocase protein TatA